MPSETLPLPGGKTHDDYAQAEAAPRKRCCRCKEQKPLTDFGRDKQSQDGHGFRCKACNCANARESRIRHPDRVKARVAAYAAKHPEIGKKSKREYYLRNPDKWRGYCAARRARKAGAGGKYTDTDIQALLIKQRTKCAHPWCRASLKRGYHVDHIISIANGGGSGRRNIQLLCAPCNRSKWIKHPTEVALAEGYLV